MRKKILISLGLFAVTFSVNSQLLPDTAAPIYGYRMTLEECIDYAFGYNLNRQAVVLNEVAREDLYDQSRLERLPSVSASVSENLTHSKGNSADWNGSYSVSTSMTLFQGGNINNTIEQNRLLTEQTAQQTARYDNQLTVQILQSFLNVLSNEELLRYQRSILAASEEQMEQGKVLYSVGSILESDYLLLEAQYVTDTANIAQTVINRDNSLLTLKSLMSMDPTENLQIVYPDSTVAAELLLLPTQEYALQRAMITLPDLIISEYDVAIAETNVKLARSSLYPTISLGGSIGSGHYNNFQNWGSQVNNRRNEQVGVSVSIPIFNKSRTRSNITQSKISLQQAELNNEQNILDVRQTVVQEYLTVRGARSSYEASVIRQNAYLESFNAYRVQYQVGAITTVELLQQQNNYINALNSYIQDKYTFILRRKILDVYMGNRIRI